MNLDTLPCELVSRCFSFLDTELLTRIVLLENIPDHIFQAVAANLNHSWYSKHIQPFENGKIAGIEAHYETDFDRFRRIHKILEKKSYKCPLWFHCAWENVFQMHQNLHEINLVHNDQKLGIHADLADPVFRYYPILSDHSLNYKVTCLSLNLFIDSCIDLDNFPRLETFYGYDCQIAVEHTHPCLKNLYLNRVTLSSLPVNLITLVANACCLRISEDHPKLQALTVLVLEKTQEPINCLPLLRKLWNNDLETFSYIDQEASNIDEVLPMIGPKVKSFGFSGPLFFRIPTLLRSLYAFEGGKLEDLSAFTHMSSLTLDLPSGFIDHWILPPNLIKLSITSACIENLDRFHLPPAVVDLELKSCGIYLTAGWLKPSRFKRLSLEDNGISSFNTSLPCCEFLCLSSNNLKEVHLEAPVLEHIDLSDNSLTSIPKLPSRIQVLIFSNNKLDLSQMSELPSNVKHLDLLGAGTGAFQDYTFPSTIQELHLTEIDLTGMSGVKFAKGSKLKSLNLSSSRLSTIHDGMIELPTSLESLDLFGNNLTEINKLTLPQTITFLDLGHNKLRSLNIKSHIETLYLNENSTLSSLEIPKDLELRVLDLIGVGLGQLPLDIIRAEKLTQLCLGPEVNVIDLLMMPANFRTLQVSALCEIRGLHSHPDKEIYRSPEEVFVCQTHKSNC